MPSSPGYQDVYLKDDTGEDYAVHDAPLFTTRKELLVYCQNIFDKL